ncbi:MAG: hypothetical protein ACOY3M_01940 [Patescibacteria group bacterium]
MIPEALKQILVFDDKGHPHLADVSDIVNRSVDPESIRPALEAYFRKHHMRVASPEEYEHHGFPRRQPRMDRMISLPKPRHFR